MCTRISKIIVLFAIFISSMLCASAENQAARADLSIEVAPYVNITPITSPVLTAHITNKSGTLYTPLSTTFRVITNKQEGTKLYLKANTITQGGYEEAMFERGGQVYIAFSNIANIPKSQSLSSCKYGSNPKDSPGVVAYPVTSISGADSRYLKSKNRYEVSANSGTSFVTVNIGQNVLQSSFGGNDPKGFYQAVLSLTESDM